MAEVAFDPESNDIVQGLSTKRLPSLLSCELFDDRTGFCFYLGNPRYLNSA